MNWDAIREYRFMLIAAIFELLTLFYVALCWDADLKPTDPWTQQMLITFSLLLVVLTFVWIHTYDKVQEMKKRISELQGYLERLGGPETEGEHELEEDS